MISTRDFGIASTEGLSSATVRPRRPAEKGGSLASVGAAKVPGVSGHPAQGALIERIHPDPQRGTAPVHSCVRRGPA